MTISQLEQIRRRRKAHALKTQKAVELQIQENLEQPLEDLQPLAPDARTDFASCDAIAQEHGLSTEIISNALTGSYPWRYSQQALSPAQRNSLQPGPSLSLAS